MPNYYDGNQHDYIIYNCTPSYNSENLKARVELLKDLPKTPMANLLSSVPSKKSHPHSTKNLVHALVKSKITITNKESKTTDMVMKDSTQIDPKLAHTELTDYVNEKNITLFNKQQGDVDAKGEEK